MENTKKSDRSLIIDFGVNGNHEAFNLLYERYNSRLLKSITFKANGNKTLAEDVVSETWKIVIDKIDYHINKAESKEYSFIGLLYTTARNTLINHFNKKANKEISLDSMLELSANNSQSDNKEEFDDRKPSGFISPEGNVVLHDVIYAINKLTPQQKSVFLMQFAGLSYAQIANEKGIGIHTVAEHLSNARHRLRVALS